MPRVFYDTIFFNGNDDLPRWSGYSLGYYLVKKYLEKTGKKIEEAFVDILGLCYEIVRGVNRICAVG